jgi:hypothetical protein
MKLSTLKAAERAAKRLADVFEAEAKHDPVAKQLHDSYVHLWLDRHDAWKKQAVELAARRDKGICLFTVFVPHTSYVSEHTRTPNLKLYRCYWKHSWIPGGLHVTAPSEPELAHNKFWNPEYDFNRLMHGVAA